MRAYETFTEKMIQFLTGDVHAAKLIEYCRETTSHLSVRADGIYGFRPEIRKYFQWKRTSEWSGEQEKENYRRGALYYELNEDIPNALRFYEKAGATDHIKGILIRNAERSGGNGHYYETREYYFRLPEQEVLDSPVLMAGMSILYSLMMMPDKSDEWYAQLASYAADKSHTAGQRKEAKVRLAYLDIALPHRGIKGIIPTIKNAYAMMKSGGSFPEMSATGNMPSLMNGGLDFCDWSKNDQQLAKMLGRPLEAILGRYGNGLVSIAIAESGFEKGTMSAYEVCTHLWDGYQRAAHDGKTEICFAACGVLVRQHLLEGELLSVEKTEHLIEEKIRQERVENLYRNLEAFKAWIALYTGDRQCHARFMENVPDVKDFYITDRYCHMVRLRCLIAENRLSEALDLSAFLEGYFRRYKRHFMQIENNLLMAVILYRIHDPTWKQKLAMALNEAIGYHFVRLISLEGVAVLPLLRRYDWTDIPEAYGRQVISETEKVALKYPDYLSYIPSVEVRLTARETQVLILLCNGKSMDEMCRELGISYSGLKKHNRSIYRKLGAANRTEAERKALQLGLVHRKGL